MTKEDGSIQSRELSPAERTIAFFGRPVTRIHFDLTEGNHGTGMIIVGIDPTVRIQITAGIPYEEVGTGWRRRLEMCANGDIYNAPYLGIIQSLVKGPDLSCVRLTEAAYYNTESGEFVREVGKARPGIKESRIAEYLGLEKGDRSGLEFRDNTNTLYIVRKGNLRTEDPRMRRRP